MFSLTLICKNNPVPFLSSVINPSPFSIASDGVLNFTSSLFKYIFPESYVLSPNIASTISLLLLPTSPPIPNISPFLILKLISLKTLFLVRFSTRIISSFISTFLFGKNWSSFLSIIKLTNSSSDDTSLVFKVEIVFPSRIIVILSQISKSSSILWDIYIILTPLSFKSFISLKSISVSFLLIEEVGSSIINTLVSDDKTLAISTICF